MTPLSEGTSTPSSIVRADTMLRPFGTNSPDDDVVRSPGTVTPARRRSRRVAATPVDDATLALLVTMGGAPWRTASDFRRALRRCGVASPPSVFAIAAALRATADEFGVARRIAADGAVAYGIPNRARAQRAVEFRAAVARRVARGDGGAAAERPAGAPPPRRAGTYASGLERDAAARSEAAARSDAILEATLASIEAARRLKASRARGARSDAAARATALAAAGALGALRKAVRSPAPGDAAIAAAARAAFVADYAAELETSPPELATPPPPAIRRRRSVSVAEDPAVWDVDEYPVTPGEAAVGAALRAALPAPRSGRPVPRRRARPAWR